METLPTIFPKLMEKRILAVCGHYGSGKTEFSVSLALLLRPLLPETRKLALVDLDIVNPYFRSRERRHMLEEQHISVFGSVFKSEITAEVPELGADARTPLDDQSYQVILDVGGNDSGARVLHQYRKYLTADQHQLAVVVNANRPGTADLAGALEHIRAIEDETGLKVDAIINNCHLLRETDADVIRKGSRLCAQITAETGIPLLCHCYPAALVNRGELADLAPDLLPVGMYMRESYLDK